MGEIHISKSCYYIRGRANMFIVSTLLFRDKKGKKFILIMRMSHVQHLYSNLLTYLCVKTPCPLGESEAHIP